jgi:hypothetical protein
VTVHTEIIAHTFLYFTSGTCTCTYIFVYALTIPEQKHIFILTSDSSARRHEGTHLQSGEGVAIIMRKEWTEYAKPSGTAPKWRSHCIKVCLLIYECPCQTEKECWFSVFVSYGKVEMWVSTSVSVLVSGINRVKMITEKLEEQHTAQGLANRTLNHTLTLQVCCTHPTCAHGFLHAKTYPA